MPKFVLAVSGLCLLLIAYTFLSSDRSEGTTLHSETLESTPVGVFAEDRSQGAIIQPGSGRSTVAANVAEVPEAQELEEAPLAVLPETESHLIPFEVFVLEEASQQPVVGATVSVSHFVTRDGSQLETVLPKCLTDEKGTVSLSAPEGVIWVGAWRDRLSGRSEVFALSPESENKITLQLSSGFEVRGQVTDSLTSDPIEGAVISFPTFIDHDVTQTDSNGEFCYQRFPIPKATTASPILVKAEGYTEFSGRLQVSNQGEWKFFVQDGLTPRAFGNEPPAEIAIELISSFDIVGRVLDGSGSPVADALVVAKGEYKRLSFDDAYILSPDEVEGRSDAEGYFRLKDLRRGIGHLVSASAPGWATALSAVSPSQEEYSEKEVELAIHLFDKEATISGLLVDSNGDPLSEVEVRLVPDISKLVEEFSLPNGLSVMYWEYFTDSSGTFDFSNLSGGEYAIHVYHSEHKGAETSIVLTPGQHTEARLTFIGSDLRVIQ